MKTQTAFIIIINLILNNKNLIYNKLFLYNLKLSHNIFDSTFVCSNFQTFYLITYYYLFLINIIIFFDVVLLAKYLRQF